MRALGIAFFDQAITDLASEHLLLVFRTDFFGFTVLGTKHHDLNSDVVALERHLCFNRLLEGLRQGIRCVQHTSIVDVRDVHREHIVFEFRLWRIHGDPTFAGDPTHSDFGDATQQRIVGRSFLRSTTTTACKDLGSRGGLSISTPEVSRQVATCPQVGKNGGGRGLVHGQPLASTFVLDRSFGLGETVHHCIGG